jgi:long-chain acyl-CoA synthetase
LKRAAENPLPDGAATATDPAPPPATVPQFLRLRASRSPASPAQWSRDADSRQWRSVDWREVEQRVANLSRALRIHGLRAGERVGIIAPSSAAWDWLQMAVFGARGVIVGLDPHDIDARLSAVATSAGITMLIAATPALARKFSADVQRNLRVIVLLDGSGAIDDLGAHVTLQQLLAAPETADEPWDASQPDDIATVVFTSGTTGAPKGIAHTHRQLCLAANALLDAFADIREGSHLACWLPLSNLFQRMVNICAIGRGAQTWYVENPREIMERVGEIDPHIFIGVPRFYEKLYRGIDERIATAARWKRALARWALAAGSARAKARREGSPLAAWPRFRYAVADRLVLQRLKGIMGRNLLYMISGSAPMPVWLLERFDAMGLTILEAYGISENTVPIAANRPEQFRFGSVGTVFPANEVRFADNGEILVRGQGVFSGYLGSAAMEAKAKFTPDGFYRTGDLGHIDTDGFVFIAGRESDAFKASTGRWLAPAQIEAAYMAIPYIEQIVVVGRGRPFPVALLAIDAAQLAIHHPPGRDSTADDGDAARSTMPASAPAQSRIAADIDAAGTALAPPERIRRFAVLPQPLSFEADELTPSLKLRRAVIEQKYADLIERLYTDDA